MTSQQLQRAIVDLSLTQSALATALDISDRTMRRYIAGDAPIPRVVELAIEYLLLIR
jgi:hypothetical protein